MHIFLVKLLQFYKISYIILLLKIILKGCFLQMLILVVNAGSSSLKYQLIDMDGEKVLAKGNCDRIGIDGLIFHIKLTTEDKLMKIVLSQLIQKRLKSLLILLLTVKQRQLLTACPKSQQ